MKIPRMLQDYLDETEQDGDRMNTRELLEEAKWVLFQFTVGEYYNDEYTARDASALKRFINSVSARI